MELSLGFSPCPNDTFVFHALVHGRVTVPGFGFEPRLADVETLNRMALGLEGERLDVTKISYGALPALLDEYVLLRAGGALGRGCGPLLVTRADRAGQRPARIAIPGERTTANLLLRLWGPTLPPGTPVVYSEIMPAVARGEFDAGLIIHESRFTYPAHGLVEQVDLGAWWERETGLPIPLGGIVARRALGRSTTRRIDDAIRESVSYAFARPAESAGYVREHAQELNDEVMNQHIALYVNEFSLGVGDEGARAVRELMARAATTGLAPTASDPFEA